MRSMNVSECMSKYFAVIGTFHESLKFNFKHIMHVLIMQFPTNYYACAHTVLFIRTFFTQAFSRLKFCDDDSMDRRTICAVYNSSV